MKTTLTSLAGGIVAMLLSAALCTGSAAEAPQNDHAATTQPAGASHADPAISGTETIVFLRHGEKATGGLGQLSPQGFNRAMALITALPAKYGKPDFLFAPNPAATQMREGQGKYDYVRALATIEPIAIQLGMPVQTAYGFSQIDRLNAELTRPVYANAVVYVAWEHAAEEKAVIQLMQQFGGDPTSVPHWSGGDYDSMYVIKLVRTPGLPPAIHFTHDHQGLNNLAQGYALGSRCTGETISRLLATFTLVINIRGSKLSSCVHFPFSSFKVFWVGFIFVGI